MKKGVSLHIGVDYVDAQAYRKRPPTLTVCENDAFEMKKIATLMKYKTINTLINEEATLANTLAHIKRYSKSLSAGDIFFLSFSGHGFYVKDNDGDEADGKDEGWCLYDQRILDDELYELWQLFDKDVRILVISDSCYSGTVTRSVRARNFSPVEQIKTLNLEQTVKLLASSPESRLSYVDRTYSLFTKHLLSVWDKGTFKGNYLDFYNAIIAEMPTKQSAIYQTIGKPNESFDNSRPFSI